MKKINILLTSVVLMTTLFVGTTEAGYIEPGSESEPLVSKTYVDKMKVEIDNKIREISNNSGNNSGGGTQGTSEEFQVIELKKGQTLTADASAEIIVRSGTVTALGSKDGGISNITEGKDLQTGDQIKLNHLIIIPRTDGRGIQVKSDGTFIMIKGRYKL